MVTIYTMQAIQTLTSLAEDDRNNIWIASTNNGVRILNPVTGKAKILKEMAGISNETLQGVECD